MKRIALLSHLFVAFATLPVFSQIPDPDLMRAANRSVRVDTIVNVDTVIRTEVITRTDILSRREVIVRKDSLVGNANPGALSGLQALTAVPATAPVVKPLPEAPAVVTTSEVVIPTPSGGVTEEIGELNFPPRAAEGGDYIWVPDSLEQKVRMLMEGRLPQTLPPAVMADVPSSERPATRFVTFRGDTIPTMLRTRNLGRYDRGLYNHLFIPKGIWQIGITASYGEFSTENLEILDLVSDVNFSGHIFSVRPYFSYFLGNNTAMGMRLGYTSGIAKIDSFAVDIDEDMSFNLKDISYQSRSYSAAATYNQYYGMSPNGRFGIFNEVELALSGGTSDFIRPYNSEPRHTHTTTVGAALNFSPGVCVFIMEKVSFNVSFGVFGFSLRKDKQIVNGEEMGSRFTSGANFRFNIFNINFGIAVNV